MRLHIIGPAFGLPSIDAECIAAVALTKSYCDSRHQLWELVASHEPAPNTYFPYLESGQGTFSGFNSIARHLTDPSGHVSGFAADLTAGQRADITALSAFLSSNAQPLLDVSLYTSFENYRHSTRPAFTAILPWYANFILPPRLRSRARARTSHLGLSALDIDTVHDDIIDKPPSLHAPGHVIEHETEKHARRLLGRRDTTLNSLLRSSEHAAAFRLKTLGDAFFEPLQAALGEHPFLLDTSAPEPSVVDCLAYGYLSLMLYPTLPQPWLATALKTQYPRLAAYVGRLHAHFNIGASAEEAVGAAAGKQSNLPWANPQALGAGRALAFVCSDMVRQLPAPLYEPDIGTKAQSSVLRTYAPGLLGLAATSLAFLGYWAYASNILFPRSEDVQLFGRVPRRSFANFGAAGAALAALGEQMSAQSVFEERAAVSPVSVEVVVDEDVKM